MTGFQTGIPDGVTSLDFGPLKIVFQPSGKVIISAKDGAGQHVTINFGGVSGILDAHLTDPSAPEPHKALGGLRSDDLARFFEVEDENLQRDLLAMMRRILRVSRFGWLGHHGMIVMPFWPFSDDGLLEVGSRRGKRWTADHERLISKIGRPLSRKDVEEASETAFNLFHQRRPSEYPYGVLFKFSDEKGRTRFMWFRTARLMNEIWILWRKYRPAVERMLVSPSEVEEIISSRRQAACREDSVAIALHTQL